MLWYSLEVGFRGEIRKIFTVYSPLSRPMSPRKTHIHSVHSGEAG